VIKILITGGNGFIAQSLLKDFKNKYDVICLGRDQLDLLDSEQVRQYITEGSFDVVIHAATYDAAPAFTTKDPSKVLENNLKMFFNIARCSKFFGKMLYFGSGAEFGRENWIPQMSESYFDSHIPSDQYGLSKYIMTKHTEQSSNIYNLRLFGIAGEWDDWRYRFISLACCKAVFNMPITYRQNVFFDFLYIEDLVYICEWFMLNEPEHKIYNVCNGTSIDYQTLAEKIRSISNKDLEVEADTHGLNTEYSGNNSLLLKELLDYKFTSADEYIPRMYEWTLRNQHTIDPSQFQY
jgi:UDP-glucose 4-epimerase